MKNWFPTLLGAGVIAGGLALTSCEDEFTEADAIAMQDSTLTALKKLDNDNAIALDQLNHEQDMAFRKYQDSLERIGPVVNYSVTVVAGGSANTNARTEGEAFAEGATVTVIQGGVSRTETTSAGGVATFGDLRIGEAVVTVEATDHTTVTYTTSLGSPSYDMQQDNVETTIPVFPLTVEAGASEVSGIAWAELDLTNDEPEFAVGATVRATISVESALSDYGIDFSNPDKGDVKTASYSDFVKTTTVGEDGRYSLIIPNGNADNGEGIDVNIEFLPYEAEQTFLAWQGDSLAVVTKDVIFESTSTSNDDDHFDEDLPSVYMEIAAPANNAQGFELEAKAIRRVLSYGSSYNLDNRGTDYEIGDEFAFEADEDGEIAGFVVLNVDADGQITDWYLENDLDGNLSDAYYDSKPALTDNSATGTGASFVLNFATDYEIHVKSEGSGYWDVPTVKVTREYFDNGILVKDIDDETFDIEDDITVTNGKLKADDADNIVGYTAVSASMPTFTVVAPTVRKAMIYPDDISIDDDSGEITSVSIDDGGAGYTSQPTVTFKTPSGLEIGSGASAVATVSGGEITNIQIINPGSGYMEYVNDDYSYSVAATASQSSSKQFKPASSNPNYNFNFGSGVVKQ